MLSLLFPLIPIFALFLYGSLWHLSVLCFSPYSLFEMQRPFVSHLYSYGLLSFSIVTLLLCLKGRLRFIVSLILLLVSLVMRIVDWNVFYHYGKHIDLLFWQFAFQGRQSSGMVFAQSSLITMGVGALVIAIFCGLYFYLPRPKNAPLWKSLLVSFGVWVLFLLSINGLSEVTFRSKNSPRVRGMTYLAYVPEHRFIQSLYQYKFHREDLSEKDLPSDGEIDLYAQRGIKLYSLGRDYPLRKRSIYFHQKKENVPRMKIGTNIIMVVAESFSSFFVDQTQITPNINRFKKMSYNFDIYNAATPTYHGSVAIFASSLYMFRSTLHPARNTNSDLKATAVFKDNGRTRYEWLSDILKDEGYYNYYVHGSDGAFANLEDTLRHHSFDTIITDHTPDLRTFAQKKKARWGYSDEDIFAYTVKLLKERDRSQPMFMVIDTADIHNPYDYHSKMDGVDNRVFNCAYSTDKGFGILWDYYLNSEYKEDTIFIFTADHAIFPSSPYLALRPQFKRTYYDYTPFIVHIPAAKNPVDYGEGLGSSLDIAPTILDLLDFDTENSFLGLSLFSEREKFPIIWTLPNINLERNSRGLRWSSKQHQKFLRFLKYLTYSNRLVPPAESK